MKFIDISDHCVVYPGDVRNSLQAIPDGTAQCCVTSPPYWGLRNYGVAGQLGLEKTPEEYVANMVQVFREVRRVLRDDGTLWLNLGDSYAGKGGGSQGSTSQRKGRTNVEAQKAAPRSGTGLKDKDLVGIPWMVAFALRADGWYLRSDIIWEKPNAMPSSVTDRPTNSHEFVFLLSKSPRYFYDIDAVREPCTMKPQRRLSPIEDRASHGNRQAHTEAGYRTREELGVDGHPLGRNLRNLRDVWTINTKPYKGAHFAAFPPELAARCIKAGSSEKGCCPSCGSPWKRVTKRTKKPDRPGRVQNREGDSIAEAHGADGRDGSRCTVEVETLGWEPSCKCPEHAATRCVVLDPFGGSGTVAEVANGLGRDAVLCELNLDYIELIRKRVLASGGSILDLFS